ncbi:hypothetical protein CPE01_31860 [Cellulomonas persica]|uniref:Uncharacterized protein n=1 Tax=Cellulomonas persica TaxID=76861 RepID=A0A510UXN8_9CELL|nr:hypothetical protein CPE01_31860 [Cellulomonas persica]
MRVVSRGRRVIGSAVAVVLVAGGAYAAVEMADEDLDCSASEAPTIDEALVLAVTCGHDVVALDTLNPQSSLTATPRGTVRATFDQSAVRTDVSGSWEPVDPSVVVDEDSGEIRVASPVNPITFSPADGSGFISMTSPEGVVSLDVPMALGAPPGRWHTRLLGCARRRGRGDRRGGADGAGPRRCIGGDPADRGARPAGLRGARARRRG